MTPRATYRVQLHAGFTFADAAAQVPYLARLGISHLYCSPYLQAAPGSQHGYDVVDHSRLNEELGGEAAFRDLVATLSHHGLAHILDIVPNHMATAERANRWWWDVLENGPSSRYASYFDIEWEAAGDHARDGVTVLVPILGDHYGRVIEARDLTVAREGGTFVVRYYDHALPLSPSTFDEILEPVAHRSGSAALAELSREVAVLPDARRTDAAAVRERHRRIEVLREQLAELLEAEPATAKEIDGELHDLNGNPDRLDRLLRRQNYRLAFWRTAREELDYRRFFNIETLVGLRVEDEAVFADSHELVLRLVHDGTLAGLRIDHVDGLRNPGGYLVRLRTAAPEAYIVVEKILEAGEAIPGEWPVAGTSGYDFIARVNNLFVAPENEAAMTACYERFTGETPSYGDVVYAAKQAVMQGDLASEVEHLTRLLAEVCDRHRRHRDHTRRELREALQEVLAAFPVYRTYVQPNRPSAPSDRKYIEQSISTAQERRPEIDHELLDFIGELILLQHPGSAEVEFGLRFAQVSGAVMAKGVEDTAFYRYNRLVSLNEVGGDPGVFGRSVAEFHHATSHSAEHWPETLLTLSTHDTKRSADVRARINVLSEIPDPWERAVTHFAAINESKRRDGWPDRNTEYLLYQTLVGTWPLDSGRAVAYLEKATREAKVHTSWVDPNPAYDEAVGTFVAAALADDRFVAALEQFLADERVVVSGRVNALAQIALLLTCPGVPDLYQGTELWDLSLVDPDNRRPVDYAARAAALDAVELRPSPPSPGTGVADDDIGRSKLHVISRLLADRRDHPDTYQSSYEPVDIDGPAADHAVAFSREDLVVVIPRLARRVGASWPTTTAITLASGEWRDVVNDKPVAGGRVTLATLFERLPLAVLRRERGRA